MSVPETFDALQQEHEALEDMLTSLHDASWSKESSCSGWTIADVVLHLAQTEEAVVAATTGATNLFPIPDAATTVDEIVDHWVTTERGKPAAEVLDRWKAARRDALAALRGSDPDQPLQWAAAPLKPRTLATTRHSEHWIHANDIAQPLGIRYPDGDRLWHIAWLAHKTLGYAFARAGRGDAPTCRLELTSPTGETWTFGPEDAECTVRGPAGQFCRIAGRRLEIDQADDVTAEGARARDVLTLARTYA